jgi:hypothetical protein
MSRQYSKERESPIIGIERELRLQLALLRAMDRGLPRIMLVGLLQQEEEAERRTILMERNPSGQI